MKNLKVSILIIHILLPLFTLAHGEEILLPVFGQIFSIIIFSVLFFFINEKMVLKIILFLVYLFSLGLIIYFTKGLSYNGYRGLIDVSWVFGPAIFTLLTFGILKIRSKMFNDKQQDKIDTIGFD